MFVIPDSVAIDKQQYMEEYKKQRLRCGSYKNGMYDTRFSVDEEDNSILLGFEFELECSWKHSGKGVSFEKIMSRMPEWLTVRKDCSLNTFGAAEFVTLPVTENFLEREGYNQMHDMFDILHNDYGYKRADTAGGHIHIGIKNFKDTYHMKRFVVVFSVAKDFIEKITKRKVYRWTKFVSRLPRDYTLDDFCSTYGNRSYAAAIRTDKKTVEVRLFDSTHDANEVIERVQLIRAVIELTETMDFDTVKKSGSVTLTKLLEKHISGNPERFYKITKYL